MTKPDRHIDFYSKSLVVQIRVKTVVQSRRLWSKDPEEKPLT